jgi:hypothetical protein
MLRISGLNLDMDSLIQQIALEPESVWRKGEPKFGSRPNGTEHKHQRSGANYLVSDAEFEDFEGQKSDAAEYLKLHETEIKEILSFPGLERAVLDFGISRRDVAVQSDYFPPELIKLAGGLGLGIELSQYPLSDELDGSEQSHAPDAQKAARG